MQLPVWMKTQEQMTPGTIITIDLSKYFFAMKGGVV